YATTPSCLSHLDTLPLSFRFFFTTPPPPPTSTLFPYTTLFRSLPKQPHEPPMLMLIPSAILVVLCLVIGVFPNQTVKPFLYHTVASILGQQTPSYSIAIWHGFNFPLLMSVLAIVGGITVIYILQRSVAGRVNRAPIIARFNGRRIFESIVYWVEAQAEQLLHYTYTNRLQPQVFLIISLAIGAAALPIVYGQWI